MNDEEIKETAPQEEAAPKKAKKAKADKVAELTLEIKEKDDKYLRLLAEYDNYKKRTAKERDLIELNVTAHTLGAILPLADSIERAAKSTGDAESIKSGVDMALKSFMAELIKVGLEEIPTDIPFDPNLHNAVMHVEDEAKGEGEIVEVFQKGYRFKDKVIRYAMVKVAN